MKNTAKIIATYLFIGALMMVGMRAVDTAWPSKKVKVIYYVCVSEKGRLKSCGPIPDKEAQKATQ